MLSQEFCAQCLRADSLFLPSGAKPGGFHMHTFDSSLLFPQHGEMWLCHVVRFSPLPGENCFDAQAEVAAATRAPGLQV